MAAIERYRAGDLRGSDPAIGAFEITPDDGSELDYVARSIYVGTGGDIRVTTLRDETVTFANVPSGSILPVRVVKVFATGTTATDIVGLD